MIHSNFFLSLLYTHDHSSIEVNSKFSIKHSSTKLWGCDFRRVYRNLLEVMHHVTW